MINFGIRRGDGVVVCNYNNWYDDFRSSLKKNAMRGYPIQAVYPANPPNVQPKGILLSAYIKKYLELQIENKTWNEKRNPKTFALKIMTEGDSHERVKLYEHR